MKRWLRRTLWAGAALAATAAALIAGGTQMAERKMNRPLTLEVASPAIVQDAASIERGRYLFASRGCVDCHGANGAGRTFIDDANGLLVRGPNLTPGANSSAGSGKTRSFLPLRCVKTSCWRARTRVKMNCNRCSTAPGSASFCRCFRRG